MREDGFVEAWVAPVNRLENRERLDRVPRGLTYAQAASAPRRSSPRQVIDRSPQSPEWPARSQGYQSHPADHQRLRPPSAAR
jgi:hypothetical protein